MQPDWRVGGHYGVHAYEVSPGPVRDADEPVASFLGDTATAIKRAEEAVIAVNTIRLIGTTSFISERRVEMEGREGGDWHPLTEWSRDQLDVNRKLIAARNLHPNEVLRVRERWVSTPRTTEEF